MGRRRFRLREGGGQQQRGATALEEGEEDWQHEIDQETTVGRSVGPFAPDQSGVGCTDDDLEGETAGGRGLSTGD